MSVPARDRFLALLSTALEAGTLAKLTLGKPAAGAAESGLRNIFVRPVTLKSGPHLSFVWRYATRDVTKNLPPDEAAEQIRTLLGATFLDAHLFTPLQHAQFESDAGHAGRLKIVTAKNAPAPAPDGHDREKVRVIPPDSPWLRALGVTDERGRPREAMAGKFRQIEKFAELFQHLCGEAGLQPNASRSDDASSDAGATVRVADMGAGKGYLTFAIAHLLGRHARVTGVEVRPDLVDLCNDVARRVDFPQLSFTPGDIASAPLSSLDALIALHACDTATDDALFRGIEAGARLILVSPCCQKELRPRLLPPAVMARPLRQGIFVERQAEFVTDALRALLLEYAGFRTKVFEFISTEHTAKNLMIAAIREQPAGDAAALADLRAFAAFYGINRQHLADRLGVSLLPASA